METEARGRLMRVIRDRPKSVDLDEFLSRPLLAHLATASDQGPCESPVRRHLDSRVAQDRHLPARLERDPRCAIGIVDFDPTNGLVQHVGFRGRARVERLDARREKRLLARYLGAEDARWDSRFRESLGDAESVFVGFEPETAVARDVSYLPGKGPRKR